MAKLNSTTKTYLSAFFLFMCVGRASTGHGGRAGGSDSDGSVGCEGAQRHSESHRGDAASSDQQGESISVFGLLFYTNKI